MSAADWLDKTTTENLPLALVPWRSLTRLLLRNCGEKSWVGLGAKGGETEDVETTLW